MVSQFNVQDAKTRLSDLLARVELGDEIVIARSGKPVARLVPLGELPPRSLGFVPGGDIPDSFFDPLPADEVDRWEGR